MQAILLTLLTLFFIFAPYYLQKIGHKIQLNTILSDVVICFLIGVIMGNTQQWWLPQEAYQKAAFSVAEIATAVSVLLAIPMLLMTSDIRSSIRHAPQFLLSFGLCIIAVLLATLLSVYLYPDLPHLGQTAGCMVGVYIGGTPNMVAISYALNAPNELFVILNSTDVFCSGLFFLFLTSVAKHFYSLFLPAFVPSSASIKSTTSHKLSPETPLDIALLQQNQVLDETKSFKDAFKKQSLTPIIKAVGLAILCIGFSVLVALLIPGADGNLNEMLLMIVLSTTSIFFSFSSRIQSLQGVYEFAQYLLLIFAIAVGFMANFSALAAAAPTYLTFNAILVLSLLLFHLFFAILFKIDTDTFIITSTACIFGPPFIGQVCSAIKNKEMLAPGMALGVLGLIIGTYLGILVASVIGYT
ncbi:DUF819 family protein [Aureispira sp. CCB-QB1]|uniref:DUF819 family protein n=1 Tax=Aureispira sp. CCB-QB1 TaxID=1313421 RepID=UPI000696FCB3|nr:DUF819 family protein [Aureispira sp. CCB-QB1]